MIIKYKFRINFNTKILFTGGNPDLGFSNFHFHWLIGTYWRMTFAGFALHLNIRKPLKQLL